MLQGTLFTAKPLDAQRIKQVEDRFSALLGAPVSLAVEQSEALLGGIRVEINGKAYDGSLRAQLNAVLDTLKGGED